MSRGAPAAAPVFPAPFDLTDSTIVVTGAASGIGLAMTRAVARAGGHVTMVDVGEDRLRRAADELRDAGLKVEPSVVDVTDTDSLRATIDRARDRTGVLDVVFANAGISAGPGFGAASNGSGRLQDIDEGNWNAVIAVNLTSVMHTLRIAGGHMKAQQKGRIVVTASIAGMRAEPFCHYPYAVSKAGVINLVRQAAVELAPHGVLVNGISPGFIGTDIGGGRLNDPAVRDRLAETIPLGRLGTADEVEGLALYLASPACSYLTGVVIPLDGGLTAR